MIFTRKRLSIFWYLTLMILSLGVVRDLGALIDLTQEEAVAWVHMPREKVNSLAKKVISGDSEIEGNDFLKRMVERSTLDLQRVFWLVAKQIQQKEVFHQAKEKIDPLDEDVQKQCLCAQAKELYEAWTSKKSSLKFNLNGQEMELRLRAQASDSLVARIQEAIASVKESPAEGDTLKDALDECSVGVCGGDQALNAKISSVSEVMHPQADLSLLDKVGQIMGRGSANAKPLGGLIGSDDGGDIDNQANLYDKLLYLGKKIDPNFDPEKGDTLISALDDVVESANVAHLIKYGAVDEYVALEGVMGEAPEWGGVIGSDGDPDSGLNSVDDIWRKLVMIKDVYLDITKDGEGGPLVPPESTLFNQIRAAIKQLDVESETLQEAIDQALANVGL